MSAVVKFHASWCKSCQAFGKKFRRLSQLTPASAPVRYASVEFSALPSLCRSLDITHLPAVQVHRGGERVESFSCSPRRFGEVEEMLERQVPGIIKEIRGGGGGIDGRTRFRRHAGNR